MIDHATVHPGARSAKPHARSNAVFDWLDELVGGLRVPETHRALLRVHLGVGRSQMDGATVITATRLPLLVYGALTGSEAPAMPLAGACTLLYLGADLLDNIADDEVTAAWDGWGAGEMQLAASTYLAPLYQMALAKLGGSAGASDRQLWRLSTLFRDALLEMSAGQHDDFRLSAGNDDVTVRSSRLMAERKSGAEIALFAQSAALLATGDEDVAGHFAAFGRACGTASQIGSDVLDIWDAPSHDLLNGKRTLPVAHALTQCGDVERDHLLSLLALCRHAPAAQDSVRRMLLDLGSLRYTALVIEVYGQEAHGHLQRGLAQARGSADAVAELQEMVAGLALFPAPIARGSSSHDHLEPGAVACATM